MAKHDLKPSGGPETKYHESGSPRAHETAIHQRGMHNKGPDALEPHPSGASVDSVGNTGTSSIGTIGPRVA